MAHPQGSPEPAAPRLPTSNNGHHHSSQALLTPLDSTSNLNSSSRLLSFPKETLFMRVGRVFNWSEIKVQLWLAGPMIAVSVFYFGLPFISSMFVGHLGELELASASLATSFANVTGSSLLMGMACALETFCGQAYGAKQYKKVGMYMQRAILVLGATAVVMSVIWAYMGDILVWLGQSTEIASGAGQYARWQIPTLFAYATSQPLLKYLQIQSLVTPLILIGLVTVSLHIPISWLLVYKSGLGFVGGALANSVSYWINALLLLAYVRFSPACYKTRSPISWEALRDVKGFILLAVPSAAMLCLEWWAYEILVILAGLLGNPELETSSLSICISTSSLVYMIPYGVSAAASTRVANELGALRPRAARGAAAVGMGIALSTGVIMSIIIILVRKVWANAYSDEEEVIDYVASLLPFLALSTLLDNLQGVLSGILRGVGWQKIGACVNLVAYYAVGLPVGALLAFLTDLNGEGLLIGVICGCTSQLISLAFVTCLSNWDKEVEKMASGMGSSLDLAMPLLEPEGDIYINQEKRGSGYGSGYGIRAEFLDGDIYINQEKRGSGYGSGCGIRAEFPEGDIYINQEKRGSGYGLRDEFLLS